MGHDPNDLRDRTKGLALSVITLFSALPKSVESQVIGKQVLRSGTSVGANYREAFRSRAELIAKAGEFLKELEETAYWLELLEESGIVFKKKLSDLKKERSKLAAIFVTIIKSSKRNA